MASNEKRFLMDEKFIEWQLLRTEELDKQWNQFIQDNPGSKKALENAIAKFQAVQLNRYPFTTKDKEEVYQRITRAIARHERRRKQWVTYPVAAALLAGILLLLHFALFKGESRYPFMDYNDTIIGHALPQEEIQLISDGEKMNLANDAHIDLTGEGKALVTDNENQKELQLAETGMNQLVVPYGKRTHLTLTDGTVVWLNSGSRLDFPTEFNRRSREIRVDGEIYIQVANNPKVPFMVHVEGMTILVQGTSFNVSAYHDEATKTVVLVEGIVTIKAGENQAIELLPNEKLDVSEGYFSKETVDVSEYISWRTGVLKFNQTPMSEILKKVSRYYNVQFEKTPEIELNRETFSGKLFLSTNLDSVMTSVSILSSTKYHRDGDVIRITKK
ncbi:MAG: FecR domain-containing protein [Bacteroidota bacterium]|jgi:ferric-dicitrate binding protein FerR (iron transport regulator)|nr:FecR domain-containing protein [Bacteroidota bacterium]HHU95686.1 FecR family protein [Petrimonas sp.]